MAFAMASQTQSATQLTTQSFSAAHIELCFAFTMKLATCLRSTSTRRISKIDCACRAAELVARFMNYRTLTVAVALIAVRLVVPFALAEPKAYDTVFYKGKTARLRIVFEFGYGHLETSNVKITESASGKTTKFYLSGRDGQMGTGKMRFAPVKGAKKEVLLEMDPFGDPLSTIKGSYTAAEETVPFTLTKRKKH
jgi:hypothetical protein